RPTALPCPTLFRSLNLVRGQTGALGHDLDAVVFRWVVAGRQHQPRIPGGGMGGKIKQRRRNDTQIDNIAAGGKDATQQGSTQLRAGAPAIGTKQQRLVAGAQGRGAHGLAAPPPTVAIQATARKSAGGVGAVRRTGRQEVVFWSA